MSAVRIAETDRLIDEHEAEIAAYDARVAELEEDSLRDYQIANLSRDAEDVAKSLAKDEPSRFDEQRLAQIEQTLASAERMKSILIARIDARQAQPLPFSVAA